MKKIVISLLSIACMNTVFTAKAHQEIHIQTEKKKSIDSMLREIKNIVEHPSCRIDKKVAAKLYQTYCHNEEFIELIHVFAYIRDNCVGKMSILKVIYPFSCTLDRIRQYLNCTDKHHSQRANVACTLYVNYTGTIEFLRMQSLFEELSTLHEEAIKNMTAFFIVCLVGILG